MLKGIFLSVFASLLFGVVYFLSTVLYPIQGTGLFGWRTLVTVPFVIAAVFLLKQQQEFLAFLTRLTHEPYLIVILLFNSLNIGAQMWLFLWAPVNGKAIEVSIGYLLMPLVMVLMGRFAFRERMSRVKGVAVIFAALGVFSKIWITGVFSWETAFVCVGYPVYFAVRKHFNILHLSSFLLEMLLMIPISVYFAAQVEMSWVLQQNPFAYEWLALLGLVGGIAFIAYIMASQRIPINILGLLGYLEPFMMLMVSFLIGERLEQDSYILMGCLCVAVFLLILDGMAKTKVTVFS